MKTTRNGNPLDPNYQLLGHTEIETNNSYSITKKEKEALKSSKITSLMSKAGK